MEYQIEYNHVAGAIEVRLPSGTRAAFNKHNNHLLLPFLNLCSMEGPHTAKLRTPLKQSEIEKMVAKFIADGHAIIARLKRPPPDLKLTDLNLEGLSI